jgi:HSP20 family protein
MLVKWNPFQELERTMGWWNTQPCRRPQGDDSVVAGGHWVPPVNVYEDKESLFVEAQLPGIDMKDVKISVTDHTLQLHGERKEERTEEQDNYHFREAQYGSFARSFRLPDYVNPDQATARYDKGVLTVQVPKREETKPKSIPIDVKG